LPELRRPQSKGDLLTTLTTAQPEKTEAEQVIELLQMFQAELAEEKKKNQALETQLALLNDRVNKELPAQLDHAFKDIQENFTMITKGIEAIPKQTTVAAAAKEGQQGGGIMDTIGKVIDRAVSGATNPVAAGGLSDFDKEILKTSKQIQLLSLRDTLKKVAKNAGVELAEHIVVTE
jgi:hypothetical protein